ncbi:hypothetical protein F2Q68_00003051 [Brassica cretica]|uniref:Uncharacterized protein n=1 Tax=Brassica cretica TaxID=69181 RepID=A0A8S9J9U2_BRACR|nr:hypothetical protein F2Q68_00003051 [Brassica cretica]
MERQARARNVRELLRALRHHQSHREAREGLHPRPHLPLLLRNRVSEPHRPLQDPLRSPQGLRSQHRELRRDVKDGLLSRRVLPRDLWWCPRHRGAPSRCGGIYFELCFGCCRVCSEFYHFDGFFESLDQVLAMDKVLLS